LRAIEWEHAQANAIELVAEQLCAVRPDAAFGVAAAIGDKGERIAALAAIAPHLPAPLRDEAHERAVACADADGELDARALAALADIAARVPDALLDRTVGLIAALSGHDREPTVTAAAPRTSRDQQLRMLDDAAANDYDWAYAAVVKALAPHLDESLVGHALE